MAKWIIPRHKPKGIPEWEREDRNHGKRFKLKGINSARRQLARKQKEYGEMKELADSGIEVAKLVLGSCNRKKSLPIDLARRCARTAKFETGKDIFVYECAYCGQYHLTSNPIPGAKYVFDTKGLKL